MLLNKGDILISKKYIPTELTLHKEYVVIDVRVSFSDKDICILDDSGCNWWFGQIGYFEPWTDWFFLKKEWDRINKINTLISDL